MLAIWLHLGAPQNTRKLDLQLVTNIELFSTHIESELGMLGVAGKLVKDVV
jgi:hypothetical protein